MWSITIAALLITSNVISRIQAEELEERKAQFNRTQTPVYKSDSVLEAIKVQKRDPLNSVPQSYLEQTNHVDKSQSGYRLRREFFDNNFDKAFSMFDAPSNRTGQVNYLASRTFQENNVYVANDKNALYGSHDVLIGNSISSDSNAINVVAPILVQKNNAYLGNNENAQYGASLTQYGNHFSPGKEDNIYSDPIVIQEGNTYSENPKTKTLHNYSKSIEDNKDALKPFIHQSGNFNPLRKDDEKAYADKNTELNRQRSLSSNLFYSLSYSLIILLILVS